MRPRLTVPKPPDSPTKAFLLKRLEPAAPVSTAMGASSLNKALRPPPRSSSPRMPKKLSYRAEESTLVAPDLEMPVRVAKPSTTTSSVCLRPMGACRLPYSVTDDWAMAEVAAARVDSAIRCFFIHVLLQGFAPTACI